MDDLQKQLTELHDQLSRLESLRSLLGDELTGQKKAELQERIRVLVQAGGGTLIAGDQIILGDQVGADKVGGDKWQVILGPQYINLMPDQVPPEELLRAYYRSLAEECRRLPLGVVRSEFVRLMSEQPVALDAVYVDLDVVSFPRTEGEGEHAWGLRLARGEEGERTPLLEALARPEGARAVLLGDPGSGKTTFVNYLAYLLADATANGREAALPEAWRGLLPVRLPLRAAAPHLPADAPCGTAAMLWAALRADVIDRLGQSAADVLMPRLQGRLLREGGLFLLDGLDEVPEALRRRQCLLEAVRALADSLPSGGRVLLTARPYAYADPAWYLRGFATLALAPFNQAQVLRFVDRWYIAVRPALGWDAATAQHRAEQLAAALRERDYLADLASRPLLLTLTATLHSSGGQLPEDRSELYEETVKLLLSRWQRGREVKGPDGHPVLEPGIERALGLGDAAIRSAVERLAYQAHSRQRSQGEPEGDAAPDAADIPEGDLFAAFVPMLPQDCSPAVLLGYLETRAGLLVGRREGVYAFPHRSFQEYLAACHLADTERDFAERLRDLVWDDMAWWREVFLLGVGKKRQGGLGDAVNVVNTLLPAAVGEVSPVTDKHWRAAALAGEALVELRLPGQAAGQPHYEAALRRARGWLAALLETPAALTPRERATAGDTLARLGDPRPGVLCLPQRTAQGVRAIPDILWCDVPAGPTQMGSAEDDHAAYNDERPQHTLDMPAFWVSRYPITNAQYGPFVGRGGYDDAAFWTPEGWTWRTGEGKPDLSAIDDEALRRSYASWLERRPADRRGRPFWWDDRRLGLPNRPVVGVSWYEARAYCCWLEKELRTTEGLRVCENGRVREWRVQPGTVQVRLPSEAEWEKAARGVRGRRWPWGNRWREGRANTQEAGIGETSAVGSFPNGASPCGALDMAGNAWEWTHTKWGRMTYRRPDYASPYDPSDGREEPGGPDLRVVRGGSWFITSWDARCAVRYGVTPGDWDDGVGFRVVFSLALPSGS